MIKSAFVEHFRNRTKKFAVDVVKLLQEIPPRNTMRVIDFQLTKSATSVAANYRAACRARSQAEFYARISTVVEEADETQFWLEVIHELGLSSNPKLTRLQNEALEIIKVCSKARKTMSG